MFKLTAMAVIATIAVAQMTEEDIQAAVTMEGCEFKSMEAIEAMDIDAQLAEAVVC